MKSKRGAADAIGEPLTPKVLQGLGALRRMPPTPKDFAPDGNWVNAYRIWTSGGYLRHGKKERGRLTIKRVTEGDGTHRLIVDRDIETPECVHLVSHARMRCKNDAIASPLEWSVLNRFVRNGEDQNGLTMSEGVRFRGNGAEVLCNGRRVVRPWTGTLATDWGLFEAVQRAECKGDLHLGFDVIEGLSLLKKGHRLTCRGIYSMDDGTRLHWFQQIGSGTLPYEYWLDEKHRLRIVVTLCRAYILTSAKGDAE